MKFNVGDVVRRKQDHSGRTRVVKEEWHDTDGVQYVLLDQMLDAWTVWKAADLKRVPAATPARSHAARKNS